MRQGMELALIFSEAVLEAMTEKHGPDHWRTIDARVAMDELIRILELPFEGQRAMAQVLELNQRVMQLFEAGRYYEALELGQAALAISEKWLGKDHERYTESLYNLAFLNVTISNHRLAERMLQEVMAIQRRVVTEKHPDYARSVSRLAQLYHQLGDLERAEPLHRQALEIRRATLGEMDPFYAMSVNDLGALAVAMGDYERARELYEKALAIRRETLGDEHEDCAQSLSNLAELHFNTGNDEAAATLLEEALAIYEKLGRRNDQEYALYLQNLATVLDDIGQAERARDLYTKALEIYQRTLDMTNLRCAALLHNLAVMHQAAGEPELALSRSEQAIAIDQYVLNSVFEFSAESGMRAHLVSIKKNLELLCSIALAQGTDEANEAALNLVLRWKTVVLETLCRQRHAQRLLGEDPEVRAQWERFRDATSELEQLSFRAVPDEQTAEVEVRKQALRGQVRDMEALLNRLLSERAPQTTQGDVRVADVRRQLDSRSVLVEIFRTRIFDFQATGEQGPWQPARYLAFVCSSDSEFPLQLVDLGDADEIDRQVAELRDSVATVQRSLTFASEAQLEEQYRELGRRLYEAIMAPLEAALAGAKTLYLAPDGELNRLPFEALVDESEQYLIESRRFCYLTSGRDLLRELAEPDQGTVVFADPNFDLPGSDRETASGTAMEVATNSGEFDAERLSGDVRGLSWQRLPGTAQEAAVIEALLDGTDYGPVSVFVQELALEEVLKRIDAPRVLHVGTHGFYLEDERLEAGGTSYEPLATRGLRVASASLMAQLRATENPLLRSGIVLSGANVVVDEGEDEDRAEDGWVTAQEVGMLDLLGTELVVLSACETGLGDIRTGEGVSGLRRAFIYAGAETLITSLYKVPDDATQALMTEFYTRLAGGATKLDAFRQAQLDIIEQRRDKHGAAHPFFWASFVLVGQPQ